MGIAAVGRDSPRCRQVIRPVLFRPPVRLSGWVSGLNGRPRHLCAIRGDQGHLMLEDCIASQYEVIRAIVSYYSLFCGVPRGRMCAPRSAAAGTVPFDLS